LYWIVCFNVLIQLLAATVNKWCIKFEKLERYRAVSEPCSGECRNYACDWKLHHICIDKTVKSSQIYVFQTTRSVTTFTIPYIVITGLIMNWLNKHNEQINVNSQTIDSISQLRITLVSNWFIETIAFETCSYPHTLKYQNMADEGQPSSRWHYNLNPKKHFHALVKARFEFIIQSNVITIIIIIIIIIVIIIILFVLTLHQYSLRTLLKQ